MNPEAYLKMNEVERAHWWFRGRREIISSAIAELGIKKECNILEVGCGTGGNLQMLSNFGNIRAFELDEVARTIALKKMGHLCEIEKGSCPDEIPFKDRQFDLICLFDVLEHIEEDGQTLAELKKLLTPSGRLLITVPAYQWLYGPHDEFLRHKRRYNISLLSKVCKKAGLMLVRVSYFNTLLFPLVLLTRLIEKIGKFSASVGESTPPLFLNKILQMIFSSERFLLRHINLPFGVSLICVLEKSPVSKSSE